MSYSQNIFPRRRRPTRRRTRAHHGAHVAAAGARTAGRTHPHDRSTHATRRRRRRRRRTRARTHMAARGGARRATHDAARQGGGRAEARQRRPTTTMMTMTMTRARRRARAAPKKERRRSFSGSIQKFRPKTGKFLIPIKYRNCNFFSVSYKVSDGGDLCVGEPTDARDRRDTGRWRATPSDTAARNEPTGVVPAARARQLRNTQVPSIGDLVTNAKKVTVSVLYWYEKLSSLRTKFLDRS